MQMLCPDLVGREAAVVSLSDTLSRAQDGSGGVTLLSGTAGIGKTRLANTSPLWRGGAHLRRGRRDRLEKTGKHRARGAHGDQPAKAWIHDTPFS